MRFFSSTLTKFCINWPVADIVLTAKCWRNECRNQLTKCVVRLSFYLSHHHWWVKLFRCSHAEQHSWGSGYGLTNALYNNYFIDSREVHSTCRVTSKWHFMWGKYFPISQPATSICEIKIIKSKYIVWCAETSTATNVGITRNSTAYLLLLNAIDHFICRAHREPSA